MAKHYQDAENMTQWWHTCILSLNQIRAIYLGQQQDVKGTSCSFKLFPKLSEILLFFHVQNTWNIQMKVWASHYTAKVFQQPSFYACFCTWPSQTDWDRASLLLLPLILFFLNYDFFWSRFVLTFHLILSYLIHQHLLSNKIILHSFAPRIFMTSSSKKS